MTTQTPELTPDVLAKITECILRIQDCVGFIMPELQDDAEDCVRALVVEVLAVERERWEREAYADAKAEEGKYDTN